jgi:predicted nucleic acid-binding protein
LTFLLGTNVPSEGARPRPDGRVTAWLREQRPGELFISVLTLGEIAFGAAAHARRDPIAGRRLSAWLASVRVSYGERTLGVTGEIAETWGNQRVRRSLPAVDGLLAATALIHGLTLVTRNERDFADLDVPLLNPWP